MRSSRTMVWAIMLLVFGSYQLIRGWTYTSIAKHEAATLGTITKVHHGKGSSYTYVFDVDGNRISDYSDECHTGSRPNYCDVRGQVVVYYDTNNPSETLLEEFGTAGRRRITFGAWLMGIGIALGLVKFLHEKIEGDGSDSDSDSFDDKPAPGPEILHVTPDHD